MRYASPSAAWRRGDRSGWVTGMKVTRNGRHFPSHVTPPLGMGRPTSPRPWEWAIGNGEWWEWEMMRRGGAAVTKTRWGAVWGGLPPRFPIPDCPFPRAGRWGAGMIAHSQGRGDVGRAAAGWWRWAGLQIPATQYDSPAVFADQFTPAPHQCGAAAVVAAQRFIVGFWGCFAPARRFRIAGPGIVGFRIVVHGGAVREAVGSREQTGREAARDS